MHEAGVGTDEFREVRQKRDDVVLGDFFDLVDPRDIELNMAGLSPNRFGGGLWDDANLRQRVARMRLDLEPDAKPRLGVPNGDHFGPGITRDHGSCS